MKNIIIFFALLFTLGLYSQNPNDKAIIKEGSQVDAKVVSNPIREGHFGTANDYSFHKKALVVFISGAQGTEEKPEPYTAKEYAQILQKAFSNKKYTDNPTDVVVYYKETGREGASLANVIINGEEYKTKSGSTVFTPMLVGKHIDTFADAYASLNNNK